jgi:hypothetical protein
MHYGTYIPNVMYFGMCNAPAFFQRTMQKDFAPFLEQYRENMDQYMDDWWIDSNQQQHSRASIMCASHPQFSQHMQEAFLLLKGVQMQNHATLNHTARMVGHWRRTLY